VTAARRSLRHRAGDLIVVTRLRASAALARRRRERVVHMLHIRKTGGTAVKAALARAAPVTGLRVMTHPHRVSLRDIPASDEVFFFLRDPVARFLSGFESRRREGRPAHYHPWTPAERRAFERFPTAESLALALASADDAERRPAEQAMQTMNHVKSHLRDWLNGEALLRSRRELIILVGWQETLDADFARLGDLLGLPSDSRLPTDEASSHRSAPSEPRPSFSAKAAAAISEWYRDDYRLIDELEQLGLTARPQ
jgi:hypothetical protein